jgi:hypothetical protein
VGCAQSETPSSGCRLLEGGVEEERGSSASQKNRGLQITGPAASMERKADRSSRGSGRTEACEIEERVFLVGHPSHNRDLNQLHMQNVVHIDRYVCTVHTYIVYLAAHPACCHIGLTTHLRGETRTFCPYNGAVERGACFVGRRNPQEDLRSVQK